MLVLNSLSEKPVKHLSSTKNENVTEIDKMAIIDGDGDLSNEISILSERAQRIRQSVEEAQYRCLSFKDQIDNYPALEIYKEQTVKSLNEIIEILRGSTESAHKIEDLLNKRAEQIREFNELGPSAFSWKRDCK